MCRVVYFYHSGPGQGPWKVASWLDTQTLQYLQPCPLGSLDLNIGLIQDDRVHASKP
jgi:hypothetical protein